MSELVRYDAMCRAIDAALAVDEVKAIHDKAAMLQAAARVAHNTDAEDRAYQIRMRAAKKANKLYDAGEKASRGADELGRGSQRSENRTSERTLDDLGISKQEMSEWRKLNSISDEQFEEGLATKTLPEMLAKPMPVSDDALLFIGTIRDFERREGLNEHA